MRSFTVFVYLNILDVISTLAVLHAGGQEANPITRAFMALDPSRAWWGLLLEKGIFIPVSWFALKWGVSRGLHHDAILYVWNTAYMILVVWNLQNLI